MDFSFTEEQTAIRDLSAKILDDQVTPERLKEVAAGDPATRMDRATWQALSDANLVGLSLSEAVGGSGLGFLETCIVCEQVGRTAAFVPLVASSVLGALPIAEFGTAAQQQRWLPGAADGSSILTAALVEEGAPIERPSTTARRDGGGWVLDGAKVCVPYGNLADHILVPASAEGGIAVFVIPGDSPGLVREPLETTSGQAESALLLDGLHATDDEVLAGPEAGPAVVTWARERATAAICATAVGVCAEALRLTAEYTKTRVQFDKPIATFQAVGQRAADAYIDTEGVRLTAWQAVWRLSGGLPAAEAVAIAKFWAADGGQRVVHAAQHLHGGVGVDRDYPLHRYFLWAKHLELTLGGATAQLLRLGDHLADEPVRV